MSHGPHSQPPQGARADESRAGRHPRLGSSGKIRYMQRYMGPLQLPTERPMQLPTGIQSPISAAPSPLARTVLSFITTTAFIFQTPRHSIGIACEGVPRASWRRDVWCQQNALRPGHTTLATLRARASGCFFRLRLSAANCLCWANITY